MKRKIIFVALTLLWLSLILLLSSQNGNETAQTSSVIAKKIVNLIYKNASESKIHTVHLFIRKLAHIFLFLVYGALVSVTAIVFFEKKHKVAMIVSALCIGIYAFFDEWHKQFIGGRHFDLHEVLLNLISGIFAMIIVFLFNKLLMSIRKKKC